MATVAKPLLNMKYSCFHFEYAFVFPRDGQNNRTKPY